MIDLPNKFEIVSVEVRGKEDQTQAKSHVEVT